MRKFAKRLVTHAAAVIAPLRPTQARAMAIEFDHIENASDAFDFALGCVVAAYSQRMSVLAALAFSARLGTALAASLFGLLHIIQPWSNVALKMRLLADPGFTACGTRCESWVRSVGDLPLSHWLWQQGAMAAFGALHLVAAVLLLRGSVGRLGWTSMIVAVLALIMPAFGGGGITFPVIYILLIAMMLAVGHGLARLEHWSFTRH
jgi:hypothetical protein